MFLASSATPPKWPPPFFSLLFSLPRPDTTGLLSFGSHPLCFPVCSVFFPVNLQPLSAAEVSELLANPSLPSISPHSFYLIGSPKTASMVSARAAAPHA